MEEYDGDEILENPFQVKTCAMIRCCISRILFPLTDTSNVSSSTSWSCFNLFSAASFNVAHSVANFVARFKRLLALSSKDENSERDCSAFLSSRCRVFSSSSSSITKGDNLFGGGLRAKIVKVVHV